MCVQKALSREPGGSRLEKAFVLARDYFIVAMVSMCGVGSSYANPTLGFRIRRDNTATSMIRIAFGFGNYFFEVLDCLWLRGLLL